MIRHCSFVVLLVLMFLCSSLGWAEVIPSSQALELKNRFRIDHLIDSVTLFVQRDYGSAPVVVVLPDGSKWYASRHPDTVQWVDGISGDIITIEKPTPGPWQLLGKVSQGSTIKFVSKLSIEVEPIPQPLFQGERIKVIANLVGDAQKLRIPGLDYLVEWTARFISEHQPGDENFAAGTFIVGSYKDNGEGLDERPDDGDFTGNLNLNQPWGTYQYELIARNNIFTREYRSAFRLSPIPVTVSIIKPDDPYNERWKLAGVVNEEELALSETHFSFDLVGPAGMHLPIVQNGLTESNFEIILPVVTEFGSYRLKGFVASTTIGGREITVNLPEVFFNLVEPPPPPLSEAELAELALAKAALEEQEARDKAIFWIVVVNGLLLVLGALALIIWRKRQSLALSLKQAELEMVEQEQEKPDLSASLDEIDLTLPEEN